MSKSKEPKPVSEFTEEQRVWFRINKKYEHKLQPFFGKSMALDSPECKEYEAIEQERDAELNKFRQKYCKPELIDTPDKLGRLIEVRLETIRTVEGVNGHFPHDVAKKYYNEAYDYAMELYKNNPEPPLPDFQSEPVMGLQSLRKWCVDAQKQQAEHIQADLVSTKQNAAPAKCWWMRIWIWVKRHPHSYGLTGGFIFLILFFAMGLFKAQWRNWCWGTAAFAFLGLIVSLLDGRSR